MPAMTDPTQALQSFQGALKSGLITNLQRGALDPKIYVHLDEPNGLPRFTYVRLEGKIVTALVMLVRVEPLDGLPCFQIGYAVPEKYRKQGRARSCIVAAISELAAGLGRNGIPAFYVEAVVGADNEPSMRVAEKVLSSSPKPITDQFSGEAALHYVKRVGC